MLFEIPYYCMLPQLSRFSRWSLATEAQWMDQVSFLAAKRLLTQPWKTTRDTDVSTRPINKVHAGHVRSTS
jgi:hypothetical protein